MSTKRVLFLGACVALAAAGADARALLRDSGAVAADPADLACGACKKFVAQGEDYINDPSTLDQVGEEIKKLCEDQASEQAEMVRSAREGARARNARKRARTRDAPGRPGRVTSDVTSFLPSERGSFKVLLRHVSVFFFFFRFCVRSRNAREKSEARRRSSFPNARHPAWWLSGDDSCHARAF